MKRLLFSIVVAGLICFVPFAAYGQDGSNLQATFDQAAGAMQGGEYDEAERGFRNVLAVEPGNVAALGNLGVLYSRTHRFAKAIEVDEQANKIDPTDPSILLNLGLAYLKQQNYGRARAYFEKLRAVQGGVRVTLLLATCMVLGDAPREGVDLLVSQKLDATEPSALYLEAAGYARLNEREKGQAVFRRMLENSATRAQASFLLGEALHDGHRLQEAADSFQEALKLDPAYAGGHRELGKVYISMQRSADAERELRLAIAQNPDDGSALYFLGAMLVQSAHEDAGVPLLERAETIDPDSWAIPFYLGKAAMTQGHAPVAATLLQKSAAMNADEPQVFYFLSRALRATGHIPEADAAMARVQALHSSALDAEKRAMSRDIAGAH